jgi:hypothetical protein
MTMHIAEASLAAVSEEQAALVDMIPAVEKVDRIFRSGRDRDIHDDLAQVRGACKFAAGQLAQVAAAKPPTASEAEAIANNAPRSCAFCSIKQRQRCRRMVLSRKQQQEKSQNMRLSLETL